MTYDELIKYEKYNVEIFYVVTHFVTTFCLRVDKIHQCPSQSYSKACNMPTARKTSTNKIWGREKWSRHQSAELILVTYETIWKFGEAASTKFLDGSYFCFIFCSIIACHVLIGHFSTFKNEWILHDAIFILSVIQYVRKYSILHI